MAILIRVIKLMTASVFGNIYQNPEILLSLSSVLSNNPTRQSLQFSPYLGKTRPEEVTQDLTAGESGQIRSKPMSEDKSL